MELLVASWCFPPAKNPMAFLGCGLMMAMVFHCPRVVTLDLHKACRFFFQKNKRSKKSARGGRRLVMKSFGVLLIRQKQKRWGYLGKRVNPPVGFFFLRERNDGVGKSSGF